MLILSSPNKHTRNNNIEKIHSIFFVYYQERYTLPRPREILGYTVRPYTVARMCHWVVGGQSEMSSPRQKLIDSYRSRRLKNHRSFHAFSRKGKKGSSLVLAKLWFWSGLWSGSMSCVAVHCRTLFRNSLFFCRLRAKSLVDSHTAECVVVLYQYIASCVVLTVCSDSWGKETEVLSPSITSMYARYSLLRVSGFFSPTDDATY